jgi:hypothetical protein
MNGHRIKIPEINLHVYSELILGKCVKTYIGERTVSSISGTGKTGYLHAEY